MESDIVTAFFVFLLFLVEVISNDGGATTVTDAE
jgi:hypothetical protein